MLQEAAFSGRDVLHLAVLEAILGQNEAFCDAFRLALLGAGFAGGSADGGRAREVGGLLGAQLDACGEPRRAGAARLNMGLAWAAAAPHAMLPPRAPPSRRSRSRSAVAACWALAAPNGISRLHSGRAGPRGDGHFERD